jgi:hypothetical protein
MKHASKTVLEVSHNDLRFEKTAVRSLREGLELVTPPQVKAKIASIVGVLVGFTSSRKPLVDFSKNEASQPLVARTTVPLSNSQVGSEVVLIFDEGDLDKPIILGCMRPETFAANEQSFDGEQLLFSAEREIVLRCGNASITLTRAGKILIQGAYLSSRSSGVNRVRGGSVQIN